MKKLTSIVLTLLLCVFLGSAVVNADPTVETVTFAWDQTDRTFLQDWEMHWGDAAGGPYVLLATLEYTGADQDNFEGDVIATLVGPAATTITRYFVLLACGDVPQEDETVARECSQPSNEVSHAFWIPFGGFQVPIQFRKVPTP